MPKLRGIIAFSLFCTVVVGMPATARSNSLNFYLEHDYTQGSQKTTTAEGVSKTDIHAFAQKYRLNLDRQIFPNLVLRGGGMFDRADSSVNDSTGDVDSVNTEINPFVDLSLVTPLYSAVLGYNRRQQRSESSDAPTLTLIREVRNAAFSWRPADLPSLGLQFTEADTFDKERQQQDDFSRRFLLNSGYSLDAWTIAYQGSLGQTEDRLAQLRTDEQTHSGRIGFDRRFWQNRITVGSSYQLTYRQIETTSAGSGEVTTPVPAIVGLAALDETPTEGELTATGALTDGNLTAATGVDLGSAAGEPTLRNIGLQLEPESEVNALYLSVDRELSRTVAAAFTWEIYTSNEGRDWQYVQTVAAALSIPSSTASRCVSPPCAASMSRWWWRPSRRRPSAASIIPISPSPKCRRS